MVKCDLWDESQSLSKKLQNNTNKQIHRQKAVAFWQPGSERIGEWRGIT